MSVLSEAFEQAQRESRALAARPDNLTLLKLYALYKQATEGDCHGKRPGFTDFVGRAKYDAWAGLAGTSAEQAQADYIAKVADLQAAE